MLVLFEVLLRRYLEAFLFRYGYSTTYLQSHQYVMQTVLKTRKWSLKFQVVGQATLRLAEHSLHACVLPTLVHTIPLIFHALRMLIEMALMPLHP